MSGNLRLNGGTSGYSELRAPDVAGDQVFLFPATGGTLMTTDQVVSPDGLWSRSGSTLSPANPGDNITSVGSITAGGPITTEGNKVPGFQIGTFEAQIGYQGGPKTVNGITIASAFYTAMDQPWLSPPGRGGGFWQRVGQLVTVSIDFAQGVDWAAYNSSSFAGKSDALAFALPYASGAPTPSTTHLINVPFINPTSTWRSWTTYFPVSNNTETQGPINAIQRDSNCVRFGRIVSGSADTSVSWEDFRNNATGTAGLEFQVFITYFTDDTSWTPLTGTVA